MLIWDSKDYANKQVYVIITTITAVIIIRQQLKHYFLNQIPNYFNYTPQ